MMTRIAISLSVALLVFAASPAFCKPPGDQYKSAGPAYEPDVEKSTLNRVQLTKTDVHHLGLIPKGIAPQFDRPIVRNNRKRNAHEEAFSRHQEINDSPFADRKKRNIYIELFKEDPKLQRKSELEMELVGMDLPEHETRKKRDIESPLNHEELRTKRETEVDNLNKDLALETETVEENKRTKRNYFHWIGGQTSLYSPPISSIQYQGFPSIGTPYSTFSNYRLPSTQSYHVVFPVFGGQIPIFFPPRDIHFNPGYPIYRPEQPITPTKPQINETEMPVAFPNRFGDPDDDTIEHPVWSIDGESEEVRPSTRRPQVAQKPAKPPTPPLFHRPSFGQDGEETLSGGPNEIVQQTRPTSGTTQRTTQRPRQPTVTQPPRTTTVATGKQLDRCVWAIISCCNPSNEEVRYNCFENAGCEGAFWGRSPCSKEVTLEALDAAQQFYESQP